MGKPRTAHLDGACPPARQAPGLARQIFQRILDGGETAAQRLGIDRVILLRCGRQRRRLRPQERRNPGIESPTQETDARLRLRASGWTVIAAIEAPAPIEQLKG